MIWIRAIACLIVIIAGISDARSRPTPADAAQLRAGERIYRQGMLPTGEPVLAEHQGADPLQGQSAACVNCHRRSGLGTVEGHILIPPITPKYLFRSSSANAVRMAQISRTASALTRRSYTDATLARALREGIDPEGRRFDYLMPRYRLDGASMSALIAYLRQLSHRPVPGVGEETLDFATIITPDADETERRGMLDVLEHFFGAGSEANRGEAPRQDASGQAKASSPRR